MASPHSVEDATKDLLKTIFRMCGEFRLHHLDVSDVARRLQWDYAGTKRLIGGLEQVGVLETTTFGQKVGLTDEGIVLAQRLLH